MRPQGTPNPPNDQVPLTDVSLISLVTTDRTPGPPVLEIDFSSKEITDLDPLEMLNLELAFGDTLLSGIRWRQSDFSAAEFQRSFSMRAIAESLRAFRSVQVAPLVLDGRPSELQSWVNTTFVLGTDLQFSLPIGVATLQAASNSGRVGLESAGDDARGRAHGRSQSADRHFLSAGVFDGPEGGRRPRLERPIAPAGPSCA